ncbi:MAG: hypothetical protein R3B54_09820 [Bdellovibrionota bacterium]
MRAWYFLVPRFSLGSWCFELQASTRLGVAKKWICVYGEDNENLDYPRILTPSVLGNAVEDSFYNVDIDIEEGVATTRRISITENFLREWISVSWSAKSR